MRAGLEDRLGDALGVGHEADVATLRPVAQRERPVAEQAPAEAVADAGACGCRPASIVCHARRTAPRGATTNTRRVVSASSVRSHCQTARVKRRAARAANASTSRSRARRTPCGADELREQGHDRRRGEQRRRGRAAGGQERRRVGPCRPAAGARRARVSCARATYRQRLRRPAPPSCPPGIMRTLVRSIGRC